MRTFQYRIWEVWIALGCLLGMFPGPLFAVVQLDNAFGLNGRVAAELGQLNGGHAALVQIDGKVVIAGSSSAQTGGPLNVVLLRLDQNGQLDPSFNQEGYVLNSLVAGDDEALALGQLSDGRLVIGGYTFNGNDRDFALACYSPDGKLDKDFGYNGATLHAIGNGDEEITALAVDTADRIVVVGASQGTSGKILIAARYLKNGRLDRSFGEEGLVLLGVGEDANGEGILLRKDGKILLSGSCVEQNKQSAILVGLKSDGSLDTDFGQQGVVSLAQTSMASEGYGLAQDSTGMIYLAGAVGELGSRRAALFRFTLSGTIDFDFGHNGLMPVGQGQEDAVLYDVVIHDNVLSAGGFTTEGGMRHFMLVSLCPPGIPAVQADGNMSYQELAPIQEIRINGNTRVQIRKLQTWTSALILQQMELLRTLVKEPTAQAKSPERTTHALFLNKLSAWLAPKTARASFVNQPTQGESTAGEWELQTLVTDFGGLESVCYALGVAPNGQILAVGTAGDATMSTLVAVRYIADDLIDRVVDSPGHRSSHIITLPSMEVTQTSLTTGGEISSNFPKEVVRRGVLFSLKPGQSFDRNQSSETTDVILPRLQSLAGFIVSEAVAAEPETLSQPWAALEEGITDNGEGRGVFYTRLKHLLPSSVYYLRAYAMTADGAMYYGDQLTVRTADACFIATASFGTLLHPCVQTLRQFRDTYLLSSSLGEKLVHLYYNLSPPMAAYIGQHPGLKLIVRVVLLPMIAFAWLALYLGLFPTCVLLMLVLSLVIKVGRMRAALCL
nr:delta-60 repeat domain-containing protein [uncultured Desulfobulbus sp.]